MLGGATTMQARRKARVAMDPRQQVRGYFIAGFRTLPVSAIGRDTCHLTEILVTQSMCIAGGDTAGAVCAYCDSYEMIECTASTEKELVVADWLVALQPL